MRRRASRLLGEHAIFSIIALIGHFGGLGAALRP